METLIQKLNVALTSTAIQYHYAAEHPDREFDKCQEKPCLPVIELLAEVAKAQIRADLNGDTKTVETIND